MAGASCRPSRLLPPRLTAKLQGAAADGVAGARPGGPHALGAYPGGSEGVGGTAGWEAGAPGLRGSDCRDNLSPRSAHRGAGSQHAPRWSAHSRGRTSKLGSDGAAHWVPERVPQSLPAARPFPMHTPWAAAGAPLVAAHGWCPEGSVLLNTAPAPGPRGGLASEPQQDPVPAPGKTCEDCKAGPTTEGPVQPREPPGLGGG